MEHFYRFWKKTSVISLKPNKNGEVNMGMIKIKEYHKKLLSGVNDVLKSKNFIEFISFSSVFHQYSFGNTLLIWGQNPRASRVAGMKTWNSIGRHVKKGEKGIAIFAPIVKIVKDHQEQIDVTPEAEKREERLIGFRAVYVWDIEQTEGKPVPQLNTIPPVMVGNAETLFSRILQASPVPVSFEEIKNSAKGYYVPKEKRIVLSNSLLTEEKVKTLLHEIAHHLSFTMNSNTETTEKTRQTEEVIAEGAAYIASANFGLDSSGYSFPYVASWCREPELVLSAGRDMRKVAVELIQLVDKHEENHISKQ